MTTKEIADAVILETGVDIREMSRETANVMSRAIYFKLAYEIFNVGSLAKVTKELGMNHSTALHSLKNHFNTSDDRFPPMIKQYYPEYYKHYQNVLEYLYSNDNRKLTDAEKLFDMTKKYNTLKDNTKVMREIMQDEDISHLVYRFSNVPKDKIKSLRVKVDAILNMT